MGALVTLELPDDSPALSLPWIITFGPLSDEEEWDPVVCGPYERPHALALAEEIVADEDLMAVVEPLQPHVDVARIRADIAEAKRLATEAPDADEETDIEIALDADEEYGAEDDEEDGYREDESDEYHEVDVAERPAPPSPEDVRAGIARIAARLSSG